MRSGTALTPWPKVCAAIAASISACSSACSSRTRWTWSKRYTPPLSGTATTGYHLVLGALGSGRNEHTAVDELLRFRCEALILTSPTAPETIAEVSRQTPVIELGRRKTASELDDADTVRVDDERGAHLVIDHLVSLGHRHIAHLDGGSRPGSFDRRQGYADAMRHHGLGDHIRVLPGRHEEESGAEAVREILRGGPRPTAIFAGNDRCAHGVVSALLREHIDVPEAISVVGFDDSRLSRLSYMDLTTIRQDSVQMARCAIEAALERLDGGRTTARDVVLEPLLVVRGSTAPPTP